MKENDHRKKLALKLDSEQDSAETRPIVKEQVRSRENSSQFSQKTGRGVDGSASRRTNTSSKHIEKRGSELFHISDH